MMSTAGTPARGTAGGRPRSERSSTNSRGRCRFAAAQIDVGQPRRRVRLALDPQVASPIMSTRMSARMSFSRAGSCARPRRSSGCRRCGRSPCHSTTASSPSRNSSSIGNARCASLSARASSMRNAVLEPPSLAPTNGNSLKQLGVVVAGDDQARTGSPDVPGQRRAQVHHLESCRCGVCGLERLFLDGEPERLELRR